MTSLTVFLVYATWVFNLPSQVWTWSWLSAAEWNKMVGSLDYLKWEVDSLKTKTLKTFVWATTTTYNWAWVWWYVGWDAKCAAQFWAWARMCTAADFANWRPNTSWWINTYIFSYSQAAWIYLADCNWWTSNLSTVYWVYMDVTLKPWVNSCNGSMFILCCQ